MAHDLATTPVTGITVQACGDAHLLNFGLFATPERNLSFGLNDFDETLPGLGVERQAAGHQLRGGRADRRVPAGTGPPGGPGRRRRAVAARLAQAEHHTNLDALPRLTEPVGGGRRFVEDPPLLTHVEELELLDPADLVPSARLCGWVLARAHARSGDAVAISGYLGSGNRFDRAVASFAEAYADQTEADHAAFVRSLDGSASRDRGRGGGTNQRKGDGG